MALLKVYSDVDGELSIDFAKTTIVKRHQLVFVPLESGQYFVRLSTKNPLLFKETVVNVVDSTLFYARKDDFLSKLTDTQLNSLHYVCKQMGGMQWIEELYSGLQISDDYDGIGHFQENVCVVWKNKHCGFINKRGIEIIPCIYEDFGITNNGLSTVKLNNKWGAINLQGTTIIPFQYEYCHYRSSDTFWDVSTGGRWEWEIDGHYYSGGEWGICDKHGNEIIPCEFAHKVQWNKSLFFGSKDLLKNDVTVMRPNGESCFPNIVYEELRLIEDELSLFLIKQEGKWGIIGLNGQFVLTPRYDDIDVFKNELCPVKLNGKWGIINKTGALVQQCLFDRICRDPSSGEYIVYQNNKCGVVDIKANVVLQCQFDSIAIKGSYYIVKLSNKYGFANSHGSFILSITYDSIEYCKGYIICNKNGLWGVANDKGHLIIPFYYSSISGPHDDVFVVSCKESYGLISNNGGSITGLVYDEITYRDGIGFCYNLNGLWGIMNNVGKFIIPAKYYYLGPLCNNGLALVNVGGRTPKFWEESGRILGEEFPANVEGGKWGFIDTVSYREVISPQFDACYLFNGRFTIVMIDNQMGVIDSAGNIVVPLKYSFCKILSDSLFLIAEGTHISTGNSEFDILFDDSQILNNMFGMPCRSLQWRGEDYFFVKGGVYGLSSIENEIIPPSYDSITPIKDNSFFIVNKDGKYGLIDKSGKLVIECTYESLSFIN